MANFIKQINLGTATTPNLYDFDALKFAGKSESQWKELIAARMEIVVPAGGKLPTASADTMGKLYLIPNSKAGDKNIKDEYVSIDNGASASPRYTWEKIGSSEVDLSNYVQKNTYTSGGPSTNATGSAGAATVTSADGGSQTATGSATVSYMKAATATGSDGGTGTNSNTGEAGGVTIDFSKASFAGTSATISVSGTFTPSGTISAVSAAAHTHTATPSVTTVSVISGLPNFSGGSFSGATAASFTQGAKASLTTVPASTANAFVGATVSAEGVLMFNSSAFNTDATKVTGWSTNGTDSFTANAVGVFTPASLGTLSKATVVKSVDSVDIGAAGGFTVTPTFTGTAGTVNASGAYTPAGAITGSQTVAAHSHTYTAPKAHTHTIALATATVTGTAAVAVSAHKHEVTISAHTHTLSNHTHAVDLTA